MPFIYPGHLVNGPNLIVDGVVVNNNIETILESAQQGKPIGMTNHYITSDDAKTGVLFYVDENEETTSTFLNGYVYDTIKGYMLTNIAIPQDSLLYRLKITAAVANSKIYISPISTSVPEFTKNYIKLPVAAIDSNGFISVDNHNIPIATEIDYIDYNTTQEVIIIIDKFNSDIDLTNLMMWTEVDTSAMLIGNLTYEIEPVDIDDVINTLFFKSTTKIICEGLTSNPIALNRKFNGTNSAYFQTLYLSSYFDPDSLIWDNDTITTLKANAIKSYDSQNGITYNFLLDELNNTTANYIIWGMSTTDEATIDDPIVDEEALYFITTENIVVGNIETSGATSINRQFSGNSSSSFINLYLTTDTTIIGNQSPDIAALKANTVPNGGTYPSYESSTYSFFLKEIPNEAVNYVVWGLSSAADGYIELPTVVETPFTAETVDCLTGDTLITLVDGSKKRLDEITMDDMVLSENHEPASIIALVKNLYWPNHVKYYFDNGTVIDEVREHFFYNVEQGFYASLKNWQPGEHAIDINGNQTAYLYKEVIEEEIEKFGIWTNTGSYYANDLLSSSLSNNKKYLDNASIEQIMDMMLTIDNDLLMSILESGVAQL